MEKGIGSNYPYLKSIRCALQSLYHEEQLHVLLFVAIELYPFHFGESENIDV